MPGRNRRLCARPYNFSPVVPFSSGTTTGTLIGVLTAPLIARPISSSRRRARKTLARRQPCQIGSAAGLVLLFLHSRSGIRCISGIWQTPFVCECRRAISAAMIGRIIESGSSTPYAYRNTWHLVQFKATAYVKVFSVKIASVRVYVLLI